MDCQYVGVQLTDPNAAATVIVAANTYSLRAMFVSVLCALWLKQWQITVTFECEGLSDDV